MASNDYDDLLESFMSNSTKAYNEDKTNRENADTVPASYSVSSNSDKKAKKIQRGRDIEKELVQKQEKKLNYEEQKEKNRRLTRLKNQLLKVEEDIEKLEEEKIQLSEQYDEAGRKNDIEKLLELQEKIAEIDRIEVEKMEEWEMVNEELEGEEE